MLDENAKDYLVEKGYDPTFGARPMRRAVERFLEDPLAEEILRGNLHEGQYAREDDTQCDQQNEAGQKREVTSARRAHLVVRGGTLIPIGSKILAPCESLPLPLA